jgi:cytidylate kinase
MTRSEIPLIAIDGPAASGKGTLAQAVAAELGFHYLESGALYRLVALKAMAEGVRLDDEAGLAGLAARLDAVFADGVIRLEGADVTDAIRAETMGALASKVAVFPQVRTALLGRQRAFLQRPGLVAEGRDMGTVVFPDAGVKIYVTASAEARAARRYKQLIDKGNSVILDGLLRDIRERDERDSARSAAPLRIAVDAVVLDTTTLSIAESVSFVLQRYRKMSEGSKA